MKKAGMRFPKELVSQMTLDSLRRVGGGGWKRREEMASPMVWFLMGRCGCWCACRFRCCLLFQP